MEKAEGHTTTGKSGIGIEKVEVYTFNSNFYSTLEAAQNAKMAEEILQRLSEKGMLSTDCNFQIGRVLGYIVQNYHLMPKD